MGSRIALMALVAACSAAVATGALRAHPGLSAEGQMGVASTRSTDSRCSRQATTEPVRSVVAASNAGDLVAIDRLVAPEPAFQWFLATGPNRAVRRLGDEAKDRSTLRAYVRQRHHERWTPVEFNPLTLTRGADDYPRHRGPAKVDAICAGGKSHVIVWST